MINSIAEVPGTAVTNGFKSTFLFVGNFSATAQYPLNLESALNDDRVAFSARTIDRRDALDASQLLCPTPLQTGWSVGGDPSNSSLIIEFPGITNLTGMAISGPPNSTFRMFTIPENIPVEFKDSSTGDECQACPLEGPASRQVFLFVGLAANISNMRVELNTTINSGLNSLQFFQQDTVVYADPSLNPSKCSDRETVARAEVNGSWKSVSNNDHKSLVINFNRNALPVASISFYPSSALKGSYLIYFDWPPCGIFDRCSSRTNVTLEVYKTYERKEPVSTIEVDESDPATSSTIIFSGEMGALQTDDVYVMLKISNPASRGSRALSVVASAVRFVNMSAMKKLNGVVKLNINPAGAPSWESLKDSLPSRAVVSSVAATQDGRIFLGGSFRYKRSSNIILYTDEKFWPLSEGGLDGAVSSIVFFENVLYIAGSFRGTLEQRFPTNNFARYFFDTGVWKPLDFGPNLYQSAQLSIDPLSRTIYVTSADNLTSLVGWNITSETYFRLASTSGSVDRMLFDTSSLSSPSLLMSVGRMTTFEPIVSRNAAVLSTNEPPAIDFSGLDVNSVASAFVDSAKPNLVYFNGKFVFNGTAPSSESLVAYDLKNRRWQYPGLSFDGEVTCLEKAGSQYFIGGQFDRVSVNNNNNSFVKSMALWNPDSNSLTVPIAPLESATGSPRVRKAIFLPKRQEVAAFGDFTGPLGLSCTNVCLWSLESSSWKAVDFGRMTYLNVTAVEAFQNNLVLGGTFIVNNQPHFLVAWDVDSGQLNPIPVKGSVQYLAADALGKYVYVGGFSSERLVPYLSTWDGNVISDVALDPRSDIRGIQSVP
ncbi:hypothetical protein BC829DRAFT_235036 [Chytridium lagenaria]|nr:hypothetical protein BC829DRAFT_235036 [Chytridium lagenaria]